METVARARFQRGSARKMRQVVDLIRGRRVDQALNLLELVPKAAALPVRKTLQSAAANALAAEGTARLKVEDLAIKKIFVDGGPIMKRIRPMGMGRAYRINKRLCHLTVVLEGEPEGAAKTKPADVKAADKAAAAQSQGGPTGKAVRGSSAVRKRKPARPTAKAKKRSSKGS